MPLTKNAKHHKNTNVNDPLSLYYDNSTEIAINNNILLAFLQIISGWTTVWFFQTGSKWIQWNSRFVLKSKH